jgi:hypothetical protein
LLREGLSFVRMLVGGNLVKKALWRVACVDLINLYKSTFTLLTQIKYAHTSIMHVAVIKYCPIRILSAKMHGMMFCSTTSW